MAPRDGRRVATAKELQDRLAALEAKVNRQEVERIIAMNAARISEYEDRMRQAYEQAARRFLESQTDEWAFKASFLTGVLSFASREYDAILKLEDPKPFLGDLILSLVLVTVPYLPNVKDAVAAWKKAAQEWKNTGPKLQKLVKYVEEDLKDHIGAAKDIIKTIRDGLKEESAKEEQRTLDTASAVMKRELGKLQQQFALAVLTKRLLSEYIGGKGGKNLYADVTEKWRKAGLETSYDFSGKVALDGAKAIDESGQRLVYDLVRDYAQNYCKLVIDEADGRRYPMADQVKKRDDVRNYEETYLIGRFEGMSEATRREIYKRYGTKWQGVDKDRPPVRDYRDIVTVWRIPLVRRVGRKSSGPVDQVAREQELALP